MPFLVERISRYIKQFVPRHQPVVFLLDGHSSRKGINWVQYGERHNIVLVLLPANTTHFIQPCNNAISKTFQKTVRATRDTLLKMPQTNVHAMSFKLKLAVAVHAAISEDVLRNALVETEFWPVDYRFLNCFQKQTSQDNEIEKCVKWFGESGPSSAARSTKRCHCHKDTVHKMKSLLD